MFNDTILEIKNLDKSYGNSKILKDITTDSERNNIGYLVQQPRFYEYMTINEYLDFITSLSKNKSFSKEELIFNSPFK